MSRSDAGKPSRWALLPPMPWRYRSSDDRPSPSADLEMPARVIATSRCLFRPSLGRLPVLDRSPQHECDGHHTCTRTPIHTAGAALGTLCMNHRAMCICGLGRPAALQILAIATAIAAFCALHSFPIHSAHLAARFVQRIPRSSRERAC